ncbi:hypothetical protein BCD48_17120 [Pseudofrankia sp. BMG5.36]|nr:hypothetical protein BCD48_17120 [Pseudofrankia sp. BMG5.36]
MAVGLGGSAALAEPPLQAATPSSAAAASTAAPAPARRCGSLGVGAPTGERRWHGCWRRIGDLTEGINEVCG